MARMEKLFIPIVLGTNREGRQSEKAAFLMERQVREREDMDTKLFDAADFAFPQKGYGPDILHLFPEWKEAVERADGLIIVSPEYNHGYPGVVKAILDTLSRETGLHKASGIVGVSSGLMGGARMSHSLLPVMRTLGFATIWLDVYFPKIKEAFDERGELKDEKQLARIASFLDELSFLARSLKSARGSEASS